MNRPRILIVDDDPSIIEYLSVSLQARGCEVVTATDGAAAIQAVDRERPDLVILEAVMSGTDSLEVCRRMRQRSQIPVIMLTTTSESGMIEQCYELGCSYYMVKPVDYHNFMQAVQNLGKFLSLEGMRLPSIGQNGN